MRQSEEEKKRNAAAGAGGGGGGFEITALMNVIKYATSLSGAGAPESLKALIPN